MLLAALLDAAGEELRADMQQVYGLNIDDMGEAFSPWHAASLAAQLPRGSRVHSRLAELYPERPAEAERKGALLLPVEEYRALLDEEWEEA